MKRRFWGDKGAPGPERESALVRIGDVMTSQVISVTRHQSVGHVRALLAEHGIHSVPVVDQDGSAAGILTTADLEAGVAALSGTAFGEHGEGYLRLSYANSEANIRKALERMEPVFASMK